jgi:hypothetical protein
MCSCEGGSQTLGAALIISSPDELLVSLEVLAKVSTQSRQGGAIDAWKKCFIRVGFWFLVLGFQGKS